MNIGGIKVFISMSKKLINEETERIISLMGITEQSLLDKIKSFIFGDKQNDNQLKPDEVKNESNQEIMSPLCFTSYPWYVTSKFGTRTMGGKSQNHPAIDLRADYVPVVAPFSGLVDKASGFDKGSCGGMIVLENKKLGLSAKFCHMSEINTSLIGKEVSRGDKLGVSGGSVKKDGLSKSKRGNSKDAHLHFELKQNGKFVDPDKIIKKGFCPTKK